MTLSPIQKKLWHAAVSGIVAGLLYAGITTLPLPVEAKAALLALCVGTVVRSVGAILATLETQPPV